MSRKTINWKVLLFFLVYTFAFAGIGALLGGGFDLQSLTQPPLAPPAWLFPIVWTILYTLMAIAAYRVFVSEEAARGTALRTYLLQVIINAVWPLLFFRLEWRLFAFFWLILLIAAVALTMARFRPIDRPAFWLLVPYLAWITFAAYLNLAYYLVNR